MSRALLERSLIGMADCPFCCQRVYLDGCAPREELISLHVDELTKPIATDLPRWWMCSHGPAARGHRWETRGPIELRPVLALHVDVAPTADQLIAAILRALRADEHGPIPALVAQLVAHHPREGRDVLAAFGLGHLLRPPEVDTHR